MTKTKKPIIVIGSGGHAKVLIEILQERKDQIIGVLSDSLAVGAEFMGLSIIGNDDQISKYSQEEIHLVNGVGSLPGNTRRRDISKFMSDQGYIFASVIHSKSIVSSSALLAEGVQIMSGSVVQANVKIGSHCIINTGAIIDHDCVIGNNCHIGPGAVLSGGVALGNETHVGTGTSIIQNLKIGTNVVIASGSAVFRDVDSGTKFIQKK